MLSMTGFGSGESTAGPVTVQVELRSVNHRFLDMALKLPSALLFLEIELRDRLKNALARGRVTCSASLGVDPVAAVSRMDPQRINAAIAVLQDAANRLSEHTGRKHELQLEHLLQVPDLFSQEQVDFCREDLASAFMAALDQALDGLLRMKRQEGDRLIVEMRQRLDAIERDLAAVCRQTPRIAAETHRKLTERLAELTREQIDPQRLAQEVAFLADKGNINEECERLEIHLQHCRAVLDAGGQGAKRLNFLLQEMHREVNTMGSKACLMEITQLVISMKDEVESLREQVQNLE
jgi:uncharacterized protein (TIGR00255 family)